MPNERDTKLVQWLNEAYAKEAELEADLTAHIAMTQKDSYKKRLRQHLTETKAHKRQVAARIRKLGGKPSNPSVPGIPGPVGEVAGKAVAAVKGQVGTARAAITNQTETHLRNAQEELREEHVEIALYRRIQAFATEVGDRDTVQLAKGIIREEERMAKFLDAEIGRLVKEVVRTEIPRDQRGGTTARSRTRRTTASSAGSTTRSTTKRSASGSSRSGSSSSRSASSRSGSSSGRSASSSSGSASTSRSGSGSSRSGSGSSRAASSSRPRSRGSANGAGAGRSTAARSGSRRSS